MFYIMLNIFGFNGQETVSLSFTSNLFVNVLKFHSALGNVPNLRKLAPRQLLVNVYIFILITFGT